jgi:hypothetical protein
LRHNHRNSHNLIAKHAKGQPLPRLPTWTLAWVVVALASTAGYARAQDDGEANREYRIKAAYLYQFGRYVQWPAKAFLNSQSPFVIAVLQSDPIVPDLEQIAETKKIQDRPIQIRRFSSPSDVPACHILYLSSSLAPEAQAEAVRRVGKEGTLIVGDSQTFTDWGGAVRFVVEDNKIRIYIARKAAEREGLTVSAKLLQVASVVD